MSVDVDKARRDQLAPGVDLVLALARNLADLGDTAVLDGDVCLEQIAALSVSDRAAANHKVWIGSHGVSFLLVVRRIFQRRPTSSAIASSAGGRTRPRVPRSVKNISSTVRTMKAADRPKTQCGLF